MHLNRISKKARQNSPFFLGLGFLLAFWFFGYDGITFSDDVIYLRMGQQFWDGETVLSSYHFSSRWGAYLFSGYLTHFFDFNDRYGSVASLIFYLTSLGVLWKVVPPGRGRQWMVLFFVSHIFLLHFLPKVYPDSYLILWVILVPAAAVYRQSRPLFAAWAMAMAFFVGFCTKETMVLLFPFPFLILALDYKRKRPLKFYYYFFSVSLLIVSLYLLYYHLAVGDALFRFKSVNEGHYVSAYTYWDKGWWSILKRISYSPLITLIERAYWPWLVLAVPGILTAVKKQEKVSLEFALCSFCLLVGFWFMSSTLKFYNPIYLNPRHLIILVAPLSVNIAFGARKWLNNSPYQKTLFVMLAAGGSYALAFSDWIIGLFYLFLAAVLLIRREKIKFYLMGLALAVSVVFSARYQQQLKNYPHFLKTFQSAVRQVSPAAPLLTHDFIVHSQEVLLGQIDVKAPVISLGELEKIKAAAPRQLTLFVYNYYKHAYPEEQEFLDRAEAWLEEEGYRLTQSRTDRWISIEVYEIMNEK